MSRRAVRKGSGSFTRWWCLDRAALSSNCNACPLLRVPRSLTVDQDTKRLHRESKPPVATRIDASRLARREVATVFFLSSSCCYYGASELSHIIHHDIHRNHRDCTLNIALPSKLNIINIGPGRVYPPYCTPRLEPVLSLRVREDASAGLPLRRQCSVYDPCGMLKINVEHVAPTPGSSMSSITCNKCEWPNGICVMKAAAS